MAVDHARAKSLFLNASDLAEPTERAAYLDRECGGDVELRDRVEALLRANDAAPLPAPSKPDATIDSDPGEPNHGDTGDYAPVPGEVSPQRFPTSDYRSPCEPGVVIAGRYTLLQKVGEGGMGEVWVAKQAEPVKRKVALKLIKTGMDSKAVLMRFEQERQALALMDHPSIARVLDGGMTPTGQPFFVMELVNGLPLTRFCDEARLTPRERLELFVPICQAVQHAHQKGIVHRDLKPANILVTLIDGRPVPKVIDFGVAKATGEKLTEETLSTGFGAIVGTLEYMSPEQASYSGVDVDTRADIYSLGVILYELLTGLRPIDARRLKQAALTEMIRIIQEEEPAKPSTRISSDDSLPSLAALRQTDPRKLMALLRGELDWVVMKCLEKQRDRRYETANALARDVQRYLADEAVEARPPSAGYRLKKLFRRNRGAVLTVALVASALLVGTALATWQAVRATKAEEQERTAKVQAERLATDNANLAEQERKAKTTAQELATANANLATNERLAKNSAVAATLEKEKQLTLARANLFTSQMTRIDSIRETDPVYARELLFNLEACPLDLRDEAWNLTERASQRHLVATLPQNAAVVALSPDGKLLAAAEARLDAMPRTARGIVTLLEVPSGKVRGTLPEFPDRVVLLEFSPDGSKLAIVADGEPRPVPDGMGGVLLPKQAGKVQIWDIGTLKQTAIGEGHSDRIVALAFSPDGTMLATGSQDHTARFWDVATGKEKLVLKDHAKEVAAVAFSPDGKRIATGSLDNTIKLWTLDGKLQSTWIPALNPDPDFAKLKQTAEEKGGAFPSFPGATNRGYFGDGIVALDFSPDGRTLAAGNANWLIELWDVERGQTKSIIRGEKYPVQDLRFHPNGKTLLASTGQSGSSQAIKRWDLATGQLLLNLRHLWNGMSFNKDGTRLAAGTIRQIQIIDLDAPLEEVKFTVEKVKGHATTPVFNRTGNILAAGAGERIFLWNLRTRKLHKTLEGHKNAVCSLVLSPDGRTLASSSRYIPSPFAPQQDPPKDDIRLWDIETGELRGVIEAGEVNIPALAFSPDGETLAAIAWAPGSRDTIVSIWDVKTRKLRFALEKTTVGFALSRDAFLAFLPDGQTLASAAGRYLNVWNLASRKIERKYVNSGSLGEIRNMVLSPDGRTILVVGTTGARNLEVKLWNPKTGEVVSELRGEGAGGTAAFSPDGKTLVVGHARQLRFWNLLSGQSRATFNASTDQGRIGIAFGPDGNTLATALSTSASVIANDLREGRLEVKLWDVSRPAALLAFGGDPQISAIFTPDSKSLMTRVIPSDGAVRFWDLDTLRVRAVVNTTATDESSIALSPNGRLLAAGVIAGADRERVIYGGSGNGSVSGRLNLWDTQTGELIRQVEVGRGLVRSLRFSPDGKSLALVHDTSEGNTLGARSAFVRIWNLDQNRMTAAFPFPDTSGNSLAWTPDGTILALSCFDRSIRLMDVQKGTILSVLANAGGGLRYDALRFTKDGTRLVVRIRGEELMPTMWDWRAAKKVNEPIPDVFGNPDRSPDGRYELQKYPFRTELIDRRINPPMGSSPEQKP